MRPTSLVVAPLWAAAFLAACPSPVAAQTVSGVDLSPLAGGSPQQGPAVAFDGSSYLVAWEEGASVWGALLDPSGNVVVPRFAVAPPPDGATQATPAVAAASAGGFLVVWTETGAAGADIRAARVSAAGAVLDPAGLDLTTIDSGGVRVPAPGPQDRPAVAAGGGEFLVVWQDGRTDAALPQVYGTLVRADDGTTTFPDGVPISPPPPTASPNAQRSPSVATNGSGYLVAWEDVLADGSTDLVAAPVSAALAPSPAFAISTAPGDQRAPAVASNGGGYAVFWNDARSGPWQLFAARVDGTTVADPDGVAISATDAAGPPAVASDGIGYLVVHERAGSALAVRLGASGAAGAEVTVDASVLAPGEGLAFDAYGRYLEVHREDVAGVPQLGGALVTTLEQVDVSLAGTGAGSVTSSPPAIDCGATCTAKFETGSSLTLTAIPGASSTFAGWTGCPSASATSCAITLTGPVSVTATFAPALPGQGGVPTFSAITATSVSVSWTVSKDATGYELERAPDAGGAPGAFALVFSGAATSYPDAGLSPATTYWYRVRGTNGAGAGAYGTATSVTTLPAAPAAPGAPTYQSVGVTSFTVSWSAVAGATRYALERADSASGPWTPVASGIAATTFGQSGLTASTTYWFQVRASNAGGDGPFSAASSVTTLPDAPAAPTFSGVGSASATVSWTAVAGATSYKLERAAAAAGPFTPVAGGLAAPTYPDAALSANTTYWYRARATNATGDGPSSPASSVTTLPAAPGAPAFSSITTTSAVVSWTAPAGGASTYDLERATGAGAFAAVATGLFAATFADTGLAPGTAYAYRVRANGPGGLGAYSASASVTTLPGAPSAPAFSGVGATSATATWGAVAGATTYKLERATSSAGPFTQVAGGLAAPTYLDPALAANTTYWYRARATNASGDGPYSPATSVTTLPAAPGAPKLSAISETTLTVTWTAPAGGASSYEVQRGSSATGPWTTIAPAVAGLSFPDAGLAAGTTYWYQVRATTAAGVGGWSAASQVITLPVAPGAPTFSAQAAASVTVSWNAVTGASTYKVERAPDVAGAPGTFAQVTSLSGTSTTSGVLSANTRYWFRVRATNASGDGAYSPAAAAMTLPNAPGGPTFSGVTTTSLVVTWTAPTGGAVSYDLERGTSSTGPWTSLATATTTLTFSDGGLAAGTTYWYHVRGANSDGARGAWSTASVPTVPPAAQAPTFANVTTTSADVSWAAVTGATSYRLEVAPDDGTGAPGAWAQLATQPATTYASTSLTANTAYWYRLLASNASGDGAYSPAARLVTLPNPPGKPTFTAVTGTTLTVSWTAPVLGASSYDVERAPSSTGPWTPVATATTALAANDAGLTPGTTYWYRVRAANVAGARGGWSLSASVATLPGAPGGLWFTGVSTVSLTVNWNAVAGATTYRVERAPDVSGAPGTFVAVAIGLGETFFNDAVEPNTVYWYRVSGGNTNGYGTPSVATSTASLANAPGSPTFSDVAQTSLTLSWTGPVGGAGSYVVERAPAATGPWTRVASGLTSLSWSDTTVAAGTTYWYRIGAVSAAGTPGPYSLPATVTTVAPPPSAAPGIPTYSAIGTSSLTVSWSAAAGATTYKLERAPDVSGAAGTFVQIASVGLTTYADAGLAPNTRYWYRVRGATAGGDGPYSPVSFTTTLPNAPDAPVVTSIGTTSVSLAWNEPAGGAASYDLERTASVSGPWTAIAPSLATRTYTDATLSAGTAYWYRVRARNAAGAAGPYSSTRAVTTLSAAPGAPTYGAVTATSAAVSWPAVTGATGYRLERATGGGAFTLVGATATTSYVDTGTAPNTTYTYRVYSLNAASAPGPYSPTSSVTTMPGAPGAPSFSAVSATSLVVSWTAPAGGADAYDVDRSLGTTGAWTTIASGTTALAVADLGLTASTTYAYRVRARTAAGAGLYSASRSVTTASGAGKLPGAPGPLSFNTIAATSLRVTWGTATDATWYELERATATTGPWLLVGKTTFPGLTDTGLSANTTYWYRVRATNAAGAGPTSAAASIVTAPGAPGTPTFSSVGATAVTLSWSAPAGGAATYALERAANAIGPWSQVASGIAGLSQVDGGLTGNTTYWYRVRARNADGVFGLPSSSASVATAPDPATPVPGAPGTPTFASISATSLSVSWASDPLATSYVLERASGAGGPWTVVATVPTISTTDGGRTANTTYWYRVRASGAGGDGPYSPVASVTTAPAAPSAPTFAAIGANAVTVSWAAPSPGGAATYTLERGAGIYGPWTTVVAGIAATTQTDAGLASNTTYWYRVRAANAAGAYGAYSSASLVATGIDATPPPGAPGAPTYGTITAASIDVAWAAATGATSYELERAPDGGSGPGTWSLVATGLAATSYADTGRSANTVYWYRVRGVNAGGKGSASGATTAMTAPGAPGDPTFSAATATRIDVAWTAPAGGAATYQLERAPAASGTWVVLASGISGTAWTDAGLAPSTTYWYRVRATNASGVSGVASGIVPATTAADATIPPPGAPGPLAFADVTATSLSLSWAPALDATGYVVERATASGGPWTAVATVIGTTTSDSGRTANTAYWYQVRGTNGAGSGPASAARVVTAPGVPGAPTFSNVTDTAATVSWTAPAGGAASYGLERATAATGPWTTVAAGVTGLSHDDPNLSAGTTWYYRVRALNADAIAGGYSIPRTVTTAAGPGL